MKEKIDYGSRKYGDFRSIGNTPEDFMNRPISDRVFLAARSHLCPVPEEVVETYTAEVRPKSPSSDQELLDARIAGINMAISRYSECNFTMKHIILKCVAESNPSLYINLITPVARLPGELPDQSLQKKYLPFDFQEKMRLASTIYGYALPRIWWAQGGENRNKTDKRNQARILRGFEALDKVVEKTIDPIKFTVLLGEEVSRHDADPNRVIYHLLSRGILQEEGCKTMFKKTFRMMKSSTPILCDTYKKLLEKHGEPGLIEMGIVVPSDLK